MSETVLVAYATRYGSTKEVAEMIASTLAERGIVVELQPFKNVKSLKDVSAVVMGAPLQMFRWHKDALGFLQRFQKQLRELPVAVFALGPFHNEESEFMEARKEVARELAAFPWLAPISIKIIGGKYDPALLGFPFTMMPALKQLPATDIRNWDEISAWATELAGKIKPTAG